MHSLKVSILQIDNTELEYAQEMDLQAALDYIGFVGFSEETIGVDYESEVAVDDEMNVVRGY